MMTEDWFEKEVEDQSTSSSENTESNSTSSKSRSFDEIETAGTIYRDKEGFMRYDRASRHAHPGEIIAVLLAQNPDILAQVEFWFDSYKDQETPASASMAALYDH
jgi:hypothetical protein